ncbi:MAG: FAD-dependent thymidylate synthase [bacterium]|nr:FAD-dependent thymidylate synthase [bacterium]
MQIIKNKPIFEILSDEKELKEQLLRIERAGRTCYQSNKKEITLETAQKFIKMLLQRGHESVIEHSNLIVRFPGVSRGFTHEIVRHRLCSFSQESTRYVDYAKTGEGPDLENFQLKCVVPPHLDEQKQVDLEGGRKMSLVEMFEEIEKFYRALRNAGFLPQDARQILPIGLKAEIVVSANFRQWRHIFELRCGLASHWEIRSVLGELLLKLKEILPCVFEDFILAGQDTNGLNYFIKEKYAK